MNTLADIDANKIASRLVTRLAEELTLFTQSELQIAVKKKLIAEFGDAAKTLPLDETAARLAKALTSDLPKFAGGSVTYYTTDEMVKAESRYFDTVRRMAGSGDGLAAGRIETAVGDFVGHCEERGRPYDAAQVGALRYLLGPGNLKVLVGPPGAGKSAILRSVAKAHLAAGTKVFAVAPTDKATESLAEGAGGLPGLRSDHLAEAIEAGEVAEHSVVLFDEAGMEGTLRMSQIAAAAERHGIALILAGDPKQLPAPVAGEPLRPTLAILSQEPGMPRPVILESIFRQRHPGDQDAVRAAWLGQGARSVEYFDDHDDLSFCADAAKTYAAAAEAYSRNHRDGASSLVLTTDDATAAEANQVVRTLLVERGVVGKSKFIHTVTTADGKERHGELAIAPGDRLMLTGDLAARKPGGHETTLPAGIPLTVKAIAKGVIEVATDGDKSRFIPVAGKDGRPLSLPIAYGYALDLKSAQGMSVERAIFAVTGPVDAASYLVGVSRHTEQVDIMVSKKAYGSRDALAKAASSRKDKRMVYDFDPDSKPHASPDAEEEAGFAMRPTR